MPPLSNIAIEIGVSASASASDMPAGPPPMIARSGVSVVPLGTERASIKALRASSQSRPDFLQRRLEAQSSAVLSKVSRYHHKRFRLSAASRPAVARDQTLEAPH